MEYQLMAAQKPRRRTREHIVGDGFGVPQIERLRHFNELKKQKKTISYYGGDITLRQKKAHEKKLAALLREAEGDSANHVIHTYRAFVAFAGKQRKPYATGSDKTDQRFLSALGGAGERGEVCNIIKKIMFRAKIGAGKLPDEWREKLLSELGDDFWYFMLVLIAFDIEFKDVIMYNMRKLVQRGR